MATSRPTLHGAVFGVLRRLLGLTEAEAAERLGTTRKVVTHFEGGATRVGLPGRLRQMGGGLGYQPVHVQLVLRSLKLAKAGRKETRPAAALGLDAGELRCAAMQGEMELATAKRVRAGLPPNRTIRQAVQERRRVESLCRRLLAAPERLQERLVRSEKAYWSPGVVARLCELSIPAAGPRPKESLRLAHLALAAATRCPAEIRTVVEGYARFFVANALRVLSRLHEAEAANARAWQLWEAEAPSGRRPPDLAAWRPLDLTVSLRRDQERWPEAVELAERSLALAPYAVRGHIVVNESGLLLQMGAPERARAVLAKVAPLLRARADRRLVYCMHFNFARSLAELGRPEKAAGELEAAREIAHELGSALDLNRCLWLGGLIAAQQGRRQEALSCLQQARREFAHRDMPLDAADVTLDQAILHLEAGDTAAVRRLAAESAWIFSAHGIPREKLAALLTFRAAVERDAATVALVREVRSHLRGIRLAQDAPAGGAGGPASGEAPPRRGSASA